EDGIRDWSVTGVQTCALPIFLAMLDMAEHQVLPAADAIAWQSAESAVKFSLSFLSLLLFGLAIPRTTKLGLVLSLFLTVGTLARSEERRVGKEERAAV